MEDNRTLKGDDGEVDVLVDAYKRGSLSHVRFGPLGIVGEIMRQRAFRVDTAHQVCMASVREGRGMTAQERARVDTLTNEAEQLGAVVAEWKAERRRDTEASVPMGL